MEQGMKSICSSHRLIMELDLQSLFGILHVYSLAETPQLPPSQAFGLIYEGAIGQQRRTTSHCEPLVVAMLFLWADLTWVAVINSFTFPPPRQHWTTAELSYKIGSCPSEWLVITFTNPASQHRQSYYLPYLNNKISSSWEKIRKYLQYRHSSPRAMYLIYRILSPILTQAGLFI